MAVFLFAVWLVMGVFFLHRMELSKNLFRVCVLALLIGLVVRFFCMDHITYDYTDFLSQWAKFFRDNGGFAAMDQQIGDYNAPYLYFMAFISYLPGKDLYFIKLFSIFFDLLLALTALRLVRKVFPGKESCAAAAFCVALLLPTVVLNGAYWAQCDSIYGALVLLALLDALDAHPGRSVVWLGIAFSVKLQAIFLIPLWCILWYSGRVKFKHLCLFPAAYFATILPAWAMGKPLKDILGVYFNQMGQYTYSLTLNAPSLYALIPNGKEVDMALWSKVGIVAAFAFVLAVLGLFFLRRKDLTGDHILTAGVLLAIGIPLMLPYMHERYFFLAEVLSVVWAFGSRRRAAVPILVQIAALGGYHAYLKLKYAFPMAWGAWMMLAALVVTAVFLVQDFWPRTAPAPTQGQKKKKPPQRR